MTSTKSFYRRPLPSSLVAFSSTEGRRRFHEALANGTAEAFFPLIEQFQTQSEPAYCGLTTLSVILNALSIDPHRVWKGPWRWFSEELLDCCRNLEDVKKEGISVSEFACLARCNGALATVTRGGDLETWRSCLKKVCSQQTDFLAVSYDRKGLGQTGEGHFSPVAAYHRETDSLLVLDVARFKYPPYWVDAVKLFDAMQVIDKSCGKSRGYVLLERGAVLPLCSRLRLPCRILGEMVNKIRKTVFPRLETYFPLQDLSKEKLVEFSNTAVDLILQQLTTCYEKQCACGSTVTETSLHDLPPILSQTPVPRFCINADSSTRREILGLVRLETEIAEQLRQSPIRKAVEANKNNGAPWLANASDEDMDSVAMLVVAILSLTNDPKVIPMVAGPKCVLCNEVRALASQLEYCLEYVDPKVNHLTIQDALLARRTSNAPGQ